MRRWPFAITCFLAIGAAGCGYFNSLYNANRQFADAERAAARGDATSAQQGYVGAIEKAAKSYRKYPNGRWSDDALHLIARARFELGEYNAGRAAATELLTSTQQRELRADAHAIAGASALRLRDATAAMVHLDSAIALSSGALQGRAYLWRARAHREAGNVAAAWADLDAVAKDDAAYPRTQLERISFGIEQGDSARTAMAFATLLTHSDARRWVDTVSDLALDAVTRFGPSAARQMLNAPLPEWIASARDSVALVRAELALRAGDTATATLELTQLAARSATLIANAARVRLAQSRLAGAASLEQLREIRAILLPAITDPNAQNLIRTMRMVEALVQKAQTSGQPVAVFAAAEIARDELAAPALARKLFITFADIAAQTPWAPKALLAALAIAPDAPDGPTLRERLQKFQGSPYAQATGAGADPDAFELAEERLHRSLIAMREEGAVLAQQQDLAVGRAVATLDSLRLVARTDSAKVSCGLLIDTLAVVGTRADSVRSACMRADTILVAEYLKIDTMKWRASAEGDSITLRRPNQRPARDTIR